MEKRLEISSYDPHWVLEFEAERDRIAQALGELACRIDHNGSTAVPGLAAKPIIDVQVSVERLQPIRAYAEPLATLGYVHVPHVDDAICPFFQRPSDWPHTHHVHVVQSGGHEERRTLAFRDFLREHSDVAREYVMLKKQLDYSRERSGFFVSRNVRERKKRVHRPRGSDCTGGGISKRVVTVNPHSELTLLPRTANCAHPRCNIAS